MKIVVTGGSGFVGRYVVERLRLEGHEVTILDLTATEEVSRVDVTDKQKVHDALDRTKPELVIHLAALAGSTGKGGGAESPKRPYEYFRINVDGTLSIYEACRELGIGRVVCMSSFSPYGVAECPINEQTPFHPNNPYGASKVCVEEVAKCYSNLYGIRSVVFRPPLICGEGQKEVNALREFVISALLGNPIVLLGEGRHLREFVHPQDVARALSAGIQYMSRMEKQYEVFVLGNRPVSMKEFAHLVISKVGRGVVEFKPSTNQVFDQFTDHSKAARVLGWVPTIGIDEIVGRVIDDVRASLATRSQAGA